MANKTLVVAHKLGEVGALARIRGLLPELKQKFSDKITDLSENWNNNTGTFSFKAMGFKISGTLTVRPTEVELVGDMPFIASMAWGKFEPKIREEAEKRLA